MKIKYKDYYIRLGLKVAYYRKIRGLTQQQLADLLCKNYSFIGQIEAPNVVKAISLDTLFEIAEALNVPIFKFLDFQDE